MRVKSPYTLASGVIIGLALGHSLSVAQAPKAPADDKLPDLAMFIDLGKYYVKPVLPRKDARTGFVIGGVNETALIRGLKELNSRTIVDLEKDMRPGATTEVGSASGFLGPDEKLLDVMAMDNQYVVDEVGLTHQELATHLHAMATIGFWQFEQKKAASTFVYRGRRFKVTFLHTKGTQPSPFLDDTESGSNATVQNLDSGKTLQYSLLVPHMIERYGFYEGKGTSYRVDPRKVVEVFDFLVKQPQKR
jgi:hypothetical protein